MGRNMDGLAGEWQVQLSDGGTYKAKLPGTLDENQIGYKDVGANQWHPDAALGNAGEGFKKDAPIATRFTRRYTYEGEAAFKKRMRTAFPAGKRIFLEAERARGLQLFVDGKRIPPVSGSLSTPYLFEVTGIPEGEHEWTLLSDNSYPGLPKEAILYSSAATDETQTNWNGILGYLGFRQEEQVFLSELSVYPGKENVRIKVRISGTVAYKGELCFRSEALLEEVRIPVSGKAGIQEFQTEELPLQKSVLRWEEGEGNLYQIQGLLTCDTEEGRVESEKKVTFGVRTFAADSQGRLALNSRTLFLRGEANCCVFPETGHPPMEVSEWKKFLEKYREYGVNCMRFHSYCPPEAAFQAADELGMLVQPELSNWNPRDAFETEESYLYYKKELEAILRTYGNHPSFVMLTLGNELQATEKGHERMDMLLKQARKLDSTRLYANGSNVHYGERGCDGESDFYTSFQGSPDTPIRATFANMEGYLNHDYPDACHQYEDAMKKIRESYQKPVFSFEVGQFEVLPDFGQIEDFKGVTLPKNLELIQKRVREKGLEDCWKQYVEATGELSRIGYREEVEAALRSPSLSGISLLGLQDFPGQGTALVGMMDSHGLPKPYAFAEPAHFNRFFRESLPLVFLKKYTYQAGETLEAEVKIANYGKRDLSGRVCWELWKITEEKPESEIWVGEENGSACGGKLWKKGSLSGENAEKQVFPAGQHTEAGQLGIPLVGLEKAARLQLRVFLEQERELENQYPVWVYPEVTPVCPAQVYEARYLDEEARQVLQRGGVVYLSPDAEPCKLPESIQAQFTTDFWSVGTFAGQEGGMGQLIDTAHPVFEEFPTQFHTNWQWWAMASARAVILPRKMKAIITEMDSYAFLREMAQLLEFRCGGGYVLFSTMGLQNLLKYPEAGALQAAIYGYLEKRVLRAENLPEITQELSMEELEKLVNK